MMKNARTWGRRLGSLLLGMLMLAMTGIGSIPAAAEETPDVSVKVFQTTSRYDMGLDHQNVRLGWSITAGFRGMYQTAYHIDPHPRFSENEKYVIFSTSELGGCDLAVVLVDDLIKATE